MVVVIIGMLVCIALALAVVGLVAVPAHRAAISTRRPGVPGPMTGPEHPGAVSAQASEPRARETVDA